jgi:hypothetical protein
MFTTSELLGRFHSPKATLQMDALRCKSPAMLRRELILHLVAYNLIRCLMVEAASLHEIDLERISFKGSMDTLRHFSPVIAQARTRRQRIPLIHQMLAALAGDPLPDRPHRVEPRCQKRRRKAYPFLMKPRADMKAKLLRKNNPSKSRRLTTGHSVGNRRCSANTCADIVAGPENARA